MNKYSAVILDLDGTIVDDESHWQQAFQNIADRHNLKRKVVPVAGLALTANWKMAGEADTCEKLAMETRSEFMKIIENLEEIKPREGFWEMISYLKEKSFLIGLATSSYWEVTDLLLEKMGIDGVFDAITTGEEVLLLKPDPEIFRLTCQKLGVEPEEVIVFEDAEAGVIAATACGCRVIKLKNNFLLAMKSIEDYEYK